MKSSALILLMSPSFLWASGPIPTDVGKATSIIPPAIDAPESTTSVAVMFRFDSHSLEPAAMSVLKPLGNSAKYDPIKTFVIEGYSDVRGSKNYNLTLSERRVRAVKNYLIEIGVHPDRIVTRAFGESRAAVNVLAISDHVKDRRVVVKVKNTGSTI